MDSLSSTRNAFDEAVFNVHHGHVATSLPGVNKLITPPVNSRAEMVALWLLFSTDVNVADRQLIVIVNSASWGVKIAASLVLQPAGQTYTYIFGVGLTSSTAAVNDYVLVAIPPSVFLLEGWTWEIRALNIQVGDQLGSGDLHEKVWTYEQ